MAFCWITINVRDIEKSLVFYREVAGLSVNRRFSPAPGMDIAFLGTAESPTEVELIYDKKNSAPTFGSDISIGFTVASLDAFMLELKTKDIPVAAGPFQPNPATRFLFVNDPDGVRVQFIENIGH